MSSSDQISPTAHYTGYVWFRHGLSDPALATARGRVLFEALAPANRVSGALGGPSLERYLLARHRALDALLAQAIEHDGIRQVVEVAAGLSPRGLRFARRYGPEITYVEGDLPAMAARKRRALERAGALGSHHRVVALDALQDGGAESLEAVAGALDPARGLIIVTEGLLGYLETAQMLALWRRFAGALAGFESSRYISDLHLGAVQTPVVRGFRLALSAFVRGRVHLHFGGAAEAEAELRRAGFAAARVRRAVDLAATAEAGGATGGAQLAHILEASTK